MTKNFGRRRLLDGGLGLGAYLLTAPGVSAADPHDHAAMMSPTLGTDPDKVVAAMDQPLVEPEVRSSVNGVLSTTIRCAYTYRPIGGVRLYVRSYAGPSPRPT